jgi:hypothetical protein
MARLSRHNPYNRYNPTACYARMLSQGIKAKAGPQLLAVFYRSGSFIFVVDTSTATFGVVAG